MSYESLTPEQKQNISDMATIANIGNDIGSIADVVGLPIYALLPILTNLAAKRLKELQATRLYNGIVYSKEIVKTMRNWAKDCIWRDYESDDIDELTDLDIIKGVEQHYQGGLRQFVIDGNPAI